MTTTAALFAAAGYASLAMGQSPGTFTATGSMITPRFGHTATLLADGRVLVAGGCTDQAGFGAGPPFGRAMTAAAEIYDPATGTFTATGSMTSPRCYHSAALLAGGRVLIVGGRAGERPEDNLASAEVYDASTGTFAPTGNLLMPGSYDDITSTVLPDGRVLITVAGNAELYDPAAGTFASTGNTTVPPPFPTATLLPDGRVLFASPFGAELYDPAVGAFSATGSMAQSDFITGRAALLPNGGVLVAGGNDDPGPVAAASVYDSSTESFTATGRMTASRADHTITTLSNGKTLIVGGSTWTDATLGSQPAMVHTCCLATAELYDPGTGSFAGTGDMATGRTGHTATLLQNGSVLIAGGSGGDTNGALATAELYYPEAAP